MRLERLAAEWAKDPHSKVFVQLAEEYVKAGMWQKAALVLQEGLLVYPGYVIAMVLLGALYQRIGDDAKAKAMLEDAVTLSPENLKAHRSLAKIYAAEGNVDSARRSCTVVLMTNPLDDEMKAIERSLPKIKRTLPAKPSEAVPTEAVPEAVTHMIAAESVDRVEARGDDEIGTVEPAMPITREDPIKSAVSADPEPIMAHHAAAQARKVTRLQTWLTHIQARRRATA